nr:MAG TPA: hypothetical protein [Caudoviricetes sp.]
MNFLLKWFVAESRLDDDWRTLQNFSRIFTERTLCQSAF